MLPRLHACLRVSCCSNRAEFRSGCVAGGRDGMMRSELEARLAFVSPSELLLSTPLSGPSQRLLGAYCSQASGVCSDTVPRDRYSQGGATAALTAFYARPGMLPAFPPPLTGKRRLMRMHATVLSLHSLGCKSLCTCSCPAGCHGLCWAWQVSLRVHWRPPWACRRL
jgi:hypothetical protein